MLKKILLALALSNALFAMHEAGLDLNQHDLNLKLNLDAGQLNTAVDPDSVFFGLRYLRGSHQHSDRLLTDDEDLFDAHFFIQQRLYSADAVTLGLGTKLVYTSIKSQDYLALPLGLLMRYDFPLNLPISFSLGGEAYYAPQVLAWEDAKTYLEYDVHLDIGIIDRAFISGGWRKIDTDFDVPGEDLIFNEAWYVGVTFRF